MYFFKFYYPKNSNKKGLVILMLILLILSILQAIKINRPLQFKMLDIGQGDSLLIQTPEYKNILIDAGINGNVIDQLSKELYFFRPTIDLFILTHGDIDHYKGMFDILEKYKVKMVLLSGVNNKGFLYQNFITAVKKRGIKIQFADSGRDIHIGQGIYLDILFPISGKSLIGQSVKNKNNVSIMARLMTQDKKGWRSLIMLAGDAEIEQEKEVLLSGQNLQAEILKVGHHGSRTSTTDAFLKAVKPTTALISVGKNNQFGHPHSETIEKLKANKIKTQSTASEGVIIISF